MRAGNPAVLALASSPRGHLATPRPPSVPCSRAAVASTLDISDFSRSPSPFSSAPCHDIGDTLAMSLHHIQSSLSATDVALPSTDGSPQAGPPMDIQEYVLQNLEIHQTPTCSRRLDVQIPTSLNSLPSPPRCDPDCTPATIYAHNLDAISYFATPLSTVNRKTQHLLFDSRHLSTIQRYDLPPPWECKQTNTCTGEFGPSTSAQHILGVNHGQHFDSYPLNERYSLPQESQSHQLEPDSAGQHGQNNSSRLADTVHQKHARLQASLDEINCHDEQQRKASSGWSDQMNPPTRFLRVSNMARKMSIWDAREMFEVFGDVKGIFTTYLRTDGVIYLEFFDIRRAAAALEKLHGAVVMQHMILIEYCSKQDMSAVSRDILSNVNDGNVMVSMSNPRLSEEDLLRLMRRYGDIVSYENQLTRDATTIMVAYYDTRCAATAVKELQEMNQKGTVQCQAHYTVQHQPREPFLQWPTSYSMSSALHPAASATRFVQDIDDRASFESVSTSPSSNALHSRDGADLVATTSRFLDSIVIPSVVERVGSLSLSSPPTPNGFTTHKKERGQTPLVMTASSRSSSADTIDAKGTDRNNAAALSTALSMTPHTTTTDSSPSTSSTSSTTTSNKSRTSRRARSFSAESCTGESKPLRPSPSSDPSPTTGITASPSSLVSSAEKPSSKLSGRNSNKGPLSDLIEGNEGPNDRRTTLMVRNIPNKYTQQMFYEWINDTHHGKFDFLYLRIDFKNKCNVGYAFVNFVSVEVIESFAQAHVGRKWPRFNSDKICELAYATVQGRDALVEKFRNSSVMKEDPNYRPKLFYTSGPRAGGEKPFPESNLDHEHPSKSHHSVRRRHSSKA